MKKKIKNILSGVIIGGLLASNIPFIYAEENTTTQDVNITVGEADRPVYNFDIDISDFGQFDWKYNSKTKLFNWESSSWKEYTYQAGQGSFDKTYYASKDLQDVKTEWNDGDKYYEHINNMIEITDRSQNGFVDSKISFVPEADYEWTGMKIDRYGIHCVPAFYHEGTTVLTNLYKDTNCDEKFDGSEVIDDTTEYYAMVNNTSSGVYQYTEVENEYVWNLHFTEINDEYTDANGSATHYITDRVSTNYINLYVENRENVIQPNPGDKIGTFTIEITPGE